MITSFYFVLWILIYFLILLSGNATLASYGFFVAFIGVYLIGRAANAMCRETIERRNRRDFITLMEIFYTDNHRQLCNILHKRFVLLAASFIYMTLATVGLLIGRADWVIIIIFAFFAFQSGRQVHAAYNLYQTVRDAGSVLIPNHPAWQQAVSQYVQQRATSTFEALCPVPTASEKALRIFNMVMSGICILIGGAFIYIYGSLMLTYGTHYPEIVINFGYGLLALVYGISDLYTLIKGFNFNILQ